MSNNSKGVAKNKNKCKKKKWGAGGKGPLKAFVKYILG